MTPRRLGGIASLTLFSALLLPSISAAGIPTPDGQRLYLQQCASCHGPNGRGDGPDAALFTSPPSDLHAGVRKSASADDVVRQVLDGRKQPVALDPQAIRARAADVESLVAYLQRIPTVDWRAADEGELIYAVRCQPCHGAYGHPTGALPPGVHAPRDFTDPAFQRTVSDAELLTAVRHGRAGKPALTPRVSEAQARQLAAFVRLLSPGFTTYSQYCANCHGEHGIGSGSFGESSMQPTAIFDRAYFARHDAEALRGKVWHMLEEHQPSMPHFRGTLSESEVRAIVEYLRARSAPH
jgi:mono/diheme cytochrome c family protein